MRKLALALIILVSACATPKTPAQTVYAIHGSYAAALATAVAYKKLPPCGQPASPVLCSDREIVVVVQKADDLAFSALTAAQNIVRTPGIDESRTTLAIAAAENGVKAFVEIVTKLKVN